MASVLEEFPTRKRHMYPWEDWGDGQVWRLLRGEDFEVEVASFQASAHTQARSEDRKVRTRRKAEGDREYLIVQFYSENGHAPAD